MNKCILLLLGTLSLILPGCDVWEDRDSCPSLLTVDCAKLEGKADRADIWIFRQEGSLESRISVPRQEFGVMQKFPVRKGLYKCIVWTDIGLNSVTADMSSLSGTIRKAAGADADPMFSFCQDVDCTRDSARAEVTPKKMFVNVTVTFKGLKDVDNVRLSLNSSWDGFVLGGKGIRQESSVISEGKDTVVMRMLRPFSFDGWELKLTYLFSDGKTADSGFALGEYLEENGYDLTEDMIRDVYITVDLSSLKTVIETEPWNEIPPVTINY